MFVQREVLEILACPKCKGDIRVTERSVNQEEDVLMCEKCNLLFPIRDRIPVMLIEEAIKVGGK